MEGTEKEELVAFFGGMYHERYQCVLPVEYLGEAKAHPFCEEREPILIAPLSHKRAILQFMRLFPHSSASEQDAFMNTGYPLFEITLVNP